MTIYYQGQKAGASGTLGASESISYLFRSDSHKDSSRDVFRHRKCPRIGSVHPDYDFLYIKKDMLSVSQGSGSSWTQWTVTAKYSALEENEEKPTEEKEVDKSTNEDGNTPDFQPKVSLSFDDFPSPLNISYNIDELDSQGNIKAGNKRETPPVASNLEPYDPPPEIFRQNATIRVARNLPIRNELFEKAMELRNTVNTKAFDFSLSSQSPKLLTIGKLQCRLKVAIGQVSEYQERKKTKLYAQLEAQFVINIDTWKTQVLDYGTYEMKPDDRPRGGGLAERMKSGDFTFPADSQKVAITDQDKNKIQGLLNGYGGELADDKAPKFNTYFGYALADHSNFFTKMLKRWPRKKG